MNSLQGLKAMINGQAKHLQLCETCSFLWCSRIAVAVNDNNISTHVLINSPTASRNHNAMC